MVLTTGTVCALRANAVVLSDNPGLLWLTLGADVRADADVKAADAGGDVGKDGEYESSVEC